MVIYKFLISRNKIILNDYITRLFCLRLYHQMIVKLFLFVDCLQFEHWGSHLDKISDLKDQWLFHLLHLIINQLIIFHCKLYELILYQQEIDN